jgi:hypothetical protein
MDATSSMKVIILAARGVAGLMPDCVADGVPEFSWQVSKSGCSTLILRYFPDTELTPPLVDVYLLRLNLL